MGAVGRNSEVTDAVYKILFWCKENVLQLIVVMVTQLCEHKKNH